MCPTDCFEPIIVVYLRRSIRPMIFLSISIAPYEEELLKIGSYNNVYNCINLLVSTVMAEKSNTVVYIDSPYDLVI